MIKGKVLTAICMLILVAGDVLTAIQIKGQEAKFPAPEPVQDSQIPAVNQKCLGTYPDIYIENHSGKAVCIWVQNGGKQLSPNIQELGSINPGEARRFSGLDMSSYGDNKQLDLYATRWTDTGEKMQAYMKLMYTPCRTTKNVFYITLPEPQYRPNISKDWHFKHRTEDNRKYTGISKTSVRHWTNYTLNPLWKEKKNQGNFHGAILCFFGDRSRDDGPQFWQWSTGDRGNIDNLDAIVLCIDL
jgi:hypothetical protein